jgi:dihydroxyacetone kinase-like predicted kinase
MKVLDYLKNFKWDIIRFQTDKSLNILGAKIVATQKSCEDRLKKLLDEKNENKQKLEQLEKKTGNTLN